MHGAAWSSEIDPEAATTLLQDGGVRPPPLRPAPFQGQHTEEVSAQLLGMAPERIAELVDAGVLEPYAETA